MLILLEGPDGGGKTTLATALRHEWGAESSLTLWHKGPPDPPDRCPYEEYELALGTSAAVSVILALNRLLLLDRWHAGDPVYQRYRPGQRTRLTSAGMLHVELVLSSLGAVKVMCLPPLEITAQRVAARGDDFIDARDLPRIHAEYAAHAALYNYWVPDWELDPAVVAKLLMSRAEESARPAGQLWHQSDGTYTGAVRPAVIFAGDELGGSVELGTRLGFTRPFTPKLSGSCSEWLLSALLAAGIINNCGLVNSGQPGVDLTELARSQPATRWVALGQQAARRLTAAQVPHQVAHHPQYARRFRHSDRAGYAAELAIAAHLPAGAGMGRERR